jgi:hypothetical protein
MELRIIDGSLQVVRAQPDSDEWAGVATLSLYARCAWCEGTGEFHGQGRGTVSCPHCDGVGKHRITLNPKDWDISLSTERGLDEFLEYLED